VIGCCLVICSVIGCCLVICSAIGCCLVISSVIGCYLVICFVIGLLFSYLLCNWNHVSSYKEDDAEGVAW